MLISIVIPVHNEEKNILPLYNELKEVLSEIKYDYEIIYVDDASTDMTLSKIMEVYTDSNNITVIQLRKQYGQSIALSVAFRYVKGDIIISLDGDLQNDPHDIPKFLSALSDDEVDVVCGWRKNRKDPFVLKVLPSKFFNMLNRFMNHLQIHDSSCTFRAYRQNAIRDIILYDGDHRNIPVILNNRGFIVKEIEINHRARKSGRSKYGLSRLLNGFFDLIMIKMINKYSKRPHRLFSKVGAFSLLIASVILIYVIIAKFILLKRIQLIQWLINFTLLIIEGIQFIFLGFIAELIIRKQNVAKEDIMKRYVGKVFNNKDIMSESKK